MAHLHTLDCLPKVLVCFVMVKVTGKVQNSKWLFICSTAEPSLTKLCMVMPHHGPECSCQKIGLLPSRLRSQWRFMWSNMTVSTESSELLSFLQPNFIGRYIIISRSVLFKNWIVVFKDKVTVKVKTSLNLYVSYIFSIPDLLPTKLGVLGWYIIISILYFLYPWSLANQTRCAWMVHHHKLECLV